MSKKRRQPHTHQLHRKTLALILSAPMAGEADVLHLLWLVSKLRPDGGWLVEHGINLMLLVAAESEPPKEKLDAPRILGSLRYVCPEAYLIRLRASEFVERSRQQQQLAAMHWDENAKAFIPDPPDAVQEVVDLSDQVANWYWLASDAVREHHASLLVFAEPVDDVPEKAVEDAVGHSLSEGMGKEVSGVIAMSGEAFSRLPDLETFRREVGQK